MRPRHRLAARTTAAVTAALVGITAGACGAEPTDSHTGAPTDAMRVGLTEWEITTQPRPLEPGEVTLTITNAGATRHDLVVHGEEGRWQTPLLAPGQHYELLVTTAPGEVLHLDCGVTGHHAAGMHSRLPVADEEPQ